MTTVKKQQQPGVIERSLPATYRVDPNGLQPHKLATVFPPYTDDEMSELVADLKANGMKNPITILNGEVLDGWNRTQAAITAGLDHVYAKLYLGSDPHGFVMSQNAIRRHLNSGQRAIVAAEMANMRQGERTDIAPNDAKSSRTSKKDAAKAMGTSTTQIDRANKLKKVDPKAHDDVRKGKLKLSTASQKAGIAPKPTKAEAKAAKAKALADHAAEQEEIARKDAEFKAENKRIMEEEDEAGRQAAANPDQQRVDEQNKAAFMDNNPAPAPAYRNGRAPVVILDDELATISALLQVGLTDIRSLMDRGQPSDKQKQLQSIEHAFAVAKGAANDFRNFLEAL